jgi:hypothetical protein
MRQWRVPGTGHFVYFTADSKIRAHSTSFAQIPHSHLTGQNGLYLAHSIIHDCLEKRSYHLRSRLVFGFHEQIPKTSLHW